MVLSGFWIQFLLHWFLSAIALSITALVIPGFILRGFGTALIASFMIGLANVYVRPLLVFLTLPLTIVTLGLFLFVVDAILLRMIAAILKNFDINNWFSAVLGAIVLAITSGALHYLIILGRANLPGV